MLFWRLTFTINTEWWTNTHTQTDWEYNTKTFALSIGRLQNLWLFLWFICFLFLCHFEYDLGFGFLSSARRAAISNTIYSQAMNSQVSLSVYGIRVDVLNMSEIRKTHSKMVFASAKWFRMSEWPNANGCAMKITFARDYRNSDKNWKRENLYTCKYKSALRSHKLQMDCCCRCCCILQSYQMSGCFVPSHSLSRSLSFFVFFTRCRLFVCFVYLLAQTSKLKSMHVVKCKCEREAASEKEKWFRILSLHWAKSKRTAAAQYI